MHRWMMENVHKIKTKLENIWIDLIRSIYALYTLRPGRKQLVKLIATIAASWKSSKHKHLIPLVILPHFKPIAALLPSLQSLLQHLLEMPHPWTLT